MFLPLWSQMQLRKIFGCWRKGDSEKMAEDLAEVLSALRKVELKSDELGYLVEEISKQSMKGAA